MLTSSTGHLYDAQKRSLGKLFPRPCRLQRCYKRTTAIYRREQHIWSCSPHNEQTATGKRDRVGVVVVLSGLPGGSPRSLLHLIHLEACTSSCNIDYLSQNLLPRNKTNEKKDLQSCAKKTTNWACPYAILTKPPMLIFYVISSTNLVNCPQK